VQPGRPARPERPVRRDGRRPARRAAAPRAPPARGHPGRGRRRVPAGDPLAPRPAADRAGGVPVTARGWEPVIGLEIHVQLATASKAFSASANLTGAPENSLTDPVVLGLPGALPTFNQAAL